jgi:predicted MPP superfamily phosphohydrolase
MPLPRKRTVAGLAAVSLALLGGYSWAFTRTRVTLDRFRVEVDRPGVPARGLTVLHLSDFHLRRGGPLQELKLKRLRRLLSCEDYDLVALTGDLIHDNGGISAVARFVATLRPRLGAFSVPGNRDYTRSGFSALFTMPPDAPSGLAARARLVAGRLARFAGALATNRRNTLQTAPNDLAGLRTTLIEHGIHPLDNGAVRLAAGDVDFWVAGVDDLMRGRSDPAAALSGVSPEALVLLLAHNPDIWLDPRAARADLVLAGHTHGGQLRVPLVGAMYRQGTHLSRRAPAGWFRRGRTRMFVSRGLGESFPFRFGAPLQAALIHIVPGNGTSASAGAVAEP